MDSSVFSFELVDSKMPKRVIENSLESIEMATKGYVHGKIEPYSGEIYPYTKKNALASVMKPFEPVEVDIQKKLGEVDPQTYKYEVFLTVKGLSHYKYRLMFIEYSEISYPVTVVLNEDVVENDLIDSFFSTRYKMTFEIDSMQELERMMEAVLNSDIVIRRIQSLINEAMRIEQDNNQVEIVNE